MKTHKIGNTTFNLNHLKDGGKAWFMKTYRGKLSVSVEAAWKELEKEIRKLPKVKKKAPKLEE